MRAFRNAEKPFNGLITDRDGYFSRVCGLRNSQRIYEISVFCFLFKVFAVCRNIYIIFGIDRYRVRAVLIHFCRDKRCVIAHQIFSNEFSHLCQQGRVVLVIPDASEQSLSICGKKFFRVRVYRISFDEFPRFCFRKRQIFIVFHSVAYRFKSQCRNQHIPADYAVALFARIAKIAVSGKSFRGVRVCPHVSGNIVAAAFVVIKKRSSPIKFSLNSVIFLHPMNYSRRKQIIVEMICRIRRRGNGASVPPNVFAERLFSRNKAFVYHIPKRAPA